MSHYYQIHFRGDPFSLRAIFIPLQTGSSAVSHHWAMAAILPQTLQLRFDPPVAFDGRSFDFFADVSTLRIVGEIGRTF